MSCVTRIQILRGSSAARLQITPLDGELVFDSDQKRLYLGDGATPGGNPLPLAPAPIQLESSSNALVMVDEDHVIHNPTADATASLPNAVGRTRPLYYMNKSAFKVDLSGVSSQTINGDLTSVMLAGYPYSALVLVPVGGNWYVF